MFPLQPSYPTTAGPEYYKIAETQEKELKTTCMNMIEVLKEELNKFFKKKKPGRHKQMCKEMKKSFKQIWGGKKAMEGNE